MKRLQTIRSIAQELPPCDDYTTAASLHSMSFWAIKMSGRVGFLRSEFPVPDRGDGKRGKIDLAFDWDGQRVYLELDSRSPRRKSVYKLCTQAGVRLIGLRNPLRLDVPDGIDAVIDLRSGEVGLPGKPA